MNDLENYWVIDKTSPGYSKAKRPEQATALKKLPNGHYELKTALLDSAAFVEAAKAHMKKNRQDVSDNFVGILKAICAIGKKSYIRLPGTRPSTPFLDDYYKGMSVIYDKLKAKLYNVYSCEVNFSLFKNSLSDITTAADFEYTREILVNPHYCSADEYDRLCEDPEPLQDPDLRRDFDIMREFAGEIEKDKNLYKACRSRLRMDQQESTANKLIWLSCHMTRRSASMQMDGLMPAIVNPARNMMKTGYTTLMEFKYTHNILCGVPITNILRDPAALFDSIQRESYDPEKKKARYGEKEAKKYAAYLVDKCNLTMRKETEKPNPHKTQKEENVLEKIKTTSSEKPPTAFPLLG